MEYTFVLLPHLQGMNSNLSCLNFNLNFKMLVCCSSGVKWVPPFFVNPVLKVECRNETLPKSHLHHRLKPALLFVCDDGNEAQPYSVCPDACVSTTKLSERVPFKQTNTNPYLDTFLSLLGVRQPIEFLSPD